MDVKLDLWSCGGKCTILVFENEQQRKKPANKEDGVTKKLRKLYIERLHKFYYSLL
jgi:hypothetical protein